MDQKPYTPKNKIAFIKALSLLLLLSSSQNNAIINI